MKIKLTESQFDKLMLMELMNTYNNRQAYTSYIDKVDSANKSLETFLYNNGVIMLNIKNGKEYLVFELEALTNMIGRRYGLVQLIKNGEPYDTIYIKPIELYRIKF